MGAHMCWPISSAPACMQRAVPVWQHQPGQVCRHRKQGARHGRRCSWLRCSTGPSQGTFSSGGGILQLHDPVDGDQSDGEQWSMPSDGLVERWLSNQQASTSAPAPPSSRSSNSSSSRDGLQTSSADAPEQPAPTVADALQLAEAAIAEGGSTLEIVEAVLPYLAGQLPAVQSQLEQPHLRASFQQLLQHAAAHSRQLRDQSLLNLLAVASISQTSDSNSASASAAANAALDELTLRPSAVSELNGSELVSLCVVLQRVAGMKGCHVSASVLQAAYVQLSNLAPSMDAMLLCVCLWCLSSFPVAPPPAILGSTLSVVAAGITALDAAGLRRLSAAMVKLRPGLEGQPAAELALLVGAVCDDVAGRVDELDVRTIAAVCELAGLFGGHVSAAFVQCTTDRLLLCMSAELEVAARAAGHLAPHLHLIGPQLRRQLLAKVLDGAGEQAVPACRFFAALARSGSRPSSSGVSSSSGSSRSSAAVVELCELACQQLAVELGLAASARASATSAAAPTPQGLRAVAVALRCCGMLGRAPTASTEQLASAAAAAAKQLRPQDACDVACGLLQLHGASSVVDAALGQLLHSEALSSQRLAVLPATALVSLATAADRGGSAYATLSKSALQAVPAPAIRDLSASLTVDLLLLLTAQQQQSGKSRCSRKGGSSDSSNGSRQSALLHGCLSALAWQARSLQPSQLQPVLQALQWLDGKDTAALVAPLSLQIEQCSPRLDASQLSHVAVALARLQWCQPLALHAVSQRGCELLPNSWQLGDLVWMAWALGRLKYQAAAAKKLLNGALKGVLAAGAAGSSVDFADDLPVGQQQRERQGTGTAGPRLDQLVNVLWACARCSHSNKALRLRLLTRICRHPGTLDVRMLSNVAWACGRLGLADDSATALIVRHAEALWPVAGMQMLSNTAWGLWKLGYNPSRTFLQGLVAAATACAPQAQPEELSSLLFVLAKWHATPDAGQLPALTAAVAQHIPRMDGNAICSCTWALVRLGAKPDASLLAAASARLEANPRQVEAPELSRFLWSCAAVGHKPRALLSATCTALRQQLGADHKYHPAAGDKQARWLCAALWGLAVQGHGDEGVLAAAEAVAARRPRMFTGLQLAGFLWSCAALNYFPGTWFDAGLTRRTTKCIATMNATDIAATVWALAQWRQHRERMGNVRLHLLLRAATERLLELAAATERDATASGSSLSSLSSLNSMDGDRSSQQAKPRTGLFAAAAARSLPSPAPAAAEAAAEEAAPASPIFKMGRLYRNVDRAPLGRLQLPARQIVTLLASLAQLGHCDERLLALLLRQLRPAAKALDVGLLSVAARGALALAYEPAELLDELEARLGPPADGQEVDAAAALGAAAGAGTNSAAAGASEPSSEGSSHGSSSSSSRATDAGTGSSGQGNGAVAWDRLMQPSSTAVRLLWSFAKAGRRLEGQALHDACSAVACEWDSCLQQSGLAISAAPGSSTTSSGSSGSILQRPSPPVTPWAAQQWPGQASSEAAAADEPWWDSGEGAGASAADVEAMMKLPLASLVAALHSLALMRQLHSEPAEKLAAQLAALPASALMQHPAFPSLSRRLAACLLAAQAERLTGSRSSSPWAQLSPQLREQLVQAWRRVALRKAAARPHAMQGEVMAALRRLGMRCSLNDATSDGCVMVDVLARAAQGERVAVELLGPHNTLRGSQRPVGEALLKWRLLAARGYRVVVVNAWEWRRLGRDDPLARLLYMQGRLEQSDDARGAPEQQTSSTTATEASDPMQDAVASEQQALVDAASRPAGEQHVAGAS